MKKPFRIVSMISKSELPAIPYWVNLDWVVSLSRVKDTREFPEHTRITLALRSDLEMVLRVKETPEIITEVWS